MDMCIQEIKKGIWWSLFADERFRKLQLYSRSVFHMDTARLKVEKRVSVGLDKEEFETVNLFHMYPIQLESSLVRQGVYSSSCGI